MKIQTDTLPDLTANDLTGHESAQDRGAALSHCSAMLTSSSIRFASLFRQDPARGPTRQPLADLNDLARLSRSHQTHSRIAAAHAALSRVGQHARSIPPLRGRARTGLA